MNWHSTKVFILGALWAAALTLAPVGYTIWSWITDPNDSSIDWRHLIKLAVFCAGPALLAYWRKHKALLQLPPALQEAIDLQKSAAEQAKAQGQG